MLCLLALLLGIKFMMKWIFFEYVLQSLRAVIGPFRSPLYLRLNVIHRLVAFCASSNRLISPIPVDLAWPRTPLCTNSMGAVKQDWLLFLWIETSIGAQSMRHLQSVTGWYQFGFAPAPACRALPSAKTNNDLNSYSVRGTYDDCNVRSEKAPNI